MKKKRAAHGLFIGLSIVFLFVSLSFIVTNGLYRCSPDGCGLFIGNWHMHDALWHVSLIRLSFLQFPFTHPFMAGEYLHGYNYGLDLVMYGLTKVGLDALFVYFRLMPICAGLLYVYAVYRLCHEIYPTDSRARNILAFFLYFGSSMSYLASLYGTHSFAYATLKGFPVVTSLQPASMFLNLPYAFSLSFMIFLILLLRRASSFKNNVLVGVVIFCLFALKFYAGAVGMLYLMIVALPRPKQNILRIAGAITGALVGWYFFYRGSGHDIPFVWSPFALTHLMIDDPLLFFNHSLTLARYYLYAHGGWTSPRLWAIEGVCVFLFFILNFGARACGFLCVVHKKRTGSPAYYLIPFLTFLIPVFFIQKGGWYNTMQFLYYGVWFASILAAQWIISIKNSMWQWGTLILIIVLSLPNTVEQLTYLQAPQRMISYDELAAMQVLEAAPPGVVHISQPTKKDAIVPAFAGKYPYYLDTDQLMVTGVEYQEKLDIIKKYSGGSISTVPAKYYLIYKADEGSNDSLRNISSSSNYKVLYDSALVRLYEHI